MKIIPIIPPRSFEVGFPENRGVITDCAHIELDFDEQVTFVTQSCTEYDVVRKKWGYYATPSLNSRLIRYKLNAVLCKNRVDQYFILLVEEGKEDQFFEYLHLEKMDIVSWLHDQKLMDSNVDKHGQNPKNCPICQNDDFRKVFYYTKPPEGEIRFDFSSSLRYYREILQCSFCGHFLSIHDMDDSSLYSGDYVNSNYQDDDGIRLSFERIIKLKPEKSDNVGRVENLLNFIKKYYSGNKINSQKLSVLDVGSGLCVFLAKMKEEGWSCTAIDPDARAIKHAEDNVGVRGICGDFLALDPCDQYELISFNKVLEHVRDPIQMLQKASALLKDDGLIYIEVPDGECASLDGKEREEFFIDHPHIFSFTSLSLLVHKAGLTPLRIERLQEPSTKYTLRAFVIKKNNSE
ncbi:class I SAM-dependent methyltransferase [Methanocalculus sp. MC3]